MWQLCHGTVADKSIALPCSTVSKDVQIRKPDTVVKRLGYVQVNAYLMSHVTLLASLRSMLLSHGSKSEDHAVVCLIYAAWLSCFVQGVLQPVHKQGPASNMPCIQLDTESQITVAKAIESIHPYTTK